MKQTIIVLILSVLFSISTNISYGFQSKYVVHTSSMDIDSKKEKALKWKDPNKEIQNQKTKALRWYEDKITKGKFYFVNSERELNSTKKKALKWYDNNNK